MSIPRQRSEVGDSTLKRNNDRTAAVGGLGGNIGWGVGGTCRAVTASARSTARLVPAVREPGGGGVIIDWREQRGPFQKLFKAAMRV